MFLQPHISAKQAKISAAKDAKADDEKKEKKVKKEPGGAVKEAAVYDGIITTIILQYIKLLFRED